MYTQSEQLLRLSRSKEGIVTTSSSMHNSSRQGQSLDARDGLVREGMARAFDHAEIVMERESPSHVMLFGDDGAEVKTLEGIAQAGMYHRPSGGHGGDGGSGDQTRQ
jgi:hypothetical protein